MAKKVMARWVEEDIPTWARFKVFVGSVKVNANLDEQTAKELVEKLNKELGNG